MNHTTKRKLIWVIGGALLVLLLAGALWPRPEPVDMAVVERGPLAVTVDEEGETRVRDRYVVSAPLAGRVLRIELEPGDPVEAGKTVLAVFQPQMPTLLDARSRAEAEAGVEAARASLERARAERDRAAAELEFAETELDRVRRLARDRIVADQELDSAELAARSRAEALEAAEFSVQTARHEVEMARARLLDGPAPANSPGDGADGPAAREGSPILIDSPVDGVVLRRLRESEAVVPAGEPLLEVGRPDDLEIVADYLSADAVRIQPGDRVSIEEWGGDGALEGRVRRVEPSGFMKISALGVEEQRVNVVVDFTEAPEARPGLADAFRVELRVVLWEGEDVLQVPTGSLFRADGEWAVFVVEEGVARLRRLEIGRRGGLAAQVIAGLDEGDRVILHPGDTVADGLRVTARSE